MEQFWTDIGDFFLKFGVKILGGAILLLVGFRFSKWLTEYIRTRHRFKKRGDFMTPTMRSFLASATGILLRLLVIVGFVLVMGASPTSIVAMLSSAALAVGLALQNSFSNIAGGLLLILFKPFALGDFITVADQSGTVQEINIYATRILTADNRTVVLPNGIVSNSFMINASTEETRRIEVQLPVAYTTDSRSVSTLLVEVASSNALILAEPAPIAVLTDLMGGVQTFSIYAWCKRADYFDALYALRMEAKETLEKHGIRLSNVRVELNLKDKDMPVS